MEVFLCLSGLPSFDVAYAIESLCGDNLIEAVNDIIFYRMNFAAVAAMLVINGLAPKIFAKLVLQNR